MPASSRACARRGCGRSSGPAKRILPAPCLSPSLSLTPFIPTMIRPRLRPIALRTMCAHRHHAVRRRAMLFLKPLFGFAASTSALTVLMMLLGQVG
jgi:hypothetical protein